MIYAEKRERPGRPETNNSQCEQNSISSSSPLKTAYFIQLASVWWYSLWCTRRIYPINIYVRLWRRVNSILQLRRCTARLGWLSFWCVQRVSKAENGCHLDAATKEESTPPISDSTRNIEKRSTHAGYSQTFSFRRGPLLTWIVPLLAVLDRVKPGVAQKRKKNTYCMSGKRAEREGRDRFAHISLWPLRGGSCLWFVI